jgi:hypothetical protein
MPTAGYVAPESESLTEDEAGAKIFELVKSVRSSQGQPEGGTSDDAADASAADEQPEEEVEVDTRDDGSADEIDPSDETTEEEPEDEEPPQKRGRTLKLSDGREQFVDEDEAYNGYLRQADYTRKTQSHSENVKAFEKTRVTVEQKREQYDAGLKQIEDALVVMMPQEPDWDRVRAERPNEYGALYTDWRRYQDRLALVKAERGRVEQERQAEQQAQVAERRKDAAERLYTLIPEWRDASKRDADRVKLTSIARDYGYGDDEIVGMEDPRMVVILRDAMLYKELRAKQAKAKAQIGKTAGPSKTARPGVPGSVSRPSSKAQAAVRRLAKSGNVEDAADAIFQSLRATKPKRK